MRLRDLKVTAIAFALTLPCVAQNPLLIPPTLSGTSFNLTVQSDSVEFYPGHKTPTFGYNGSILGPTLILNKGDVVTMNVINNINAPTTVHWHGLHVPAHADGGPHQEIPQGGSWSPDFTVMNRAGTFWYHPHGQNRTDLQVSKGLAGFIIIRDSIEAALTLPRTYGTDDFPLAIQTKCFDVLYQSAIATVFDTVPMVNATINPYLDVPAQVVRLRLLNGSSNRTFLVGLSNGQNFSLIATDGGLIETPLSLNRLRISPGERAEILVDLNGMQGQVVQMMNYGSQLPNGIIGAPDVGNGMVQIPDYDLNFLNGADYNLLQLNVVAQTLNPVLTIPNALTPLAPFDTTNINAVRAMDFAPQTMNMQAMVEGPFTINGAQFDMSVINETTYLNNVERWVVSNQTLVAHPFHIHDVQFLISDVNGATVPDYEKGWKDVVLVMPQQTVSFITKFEDFADTVPYMYHCHLLHHEDDGMMGSFVVLDTSSTGIPESETASGISIYPNPASATIFIRTTTTESFHYVIMNTVGETVYKSDECLNETSLNIQQLPAGIYFVQARTAKKIMIQRFVKSN